MADLNFLDFILLAFGLWLVRRILVRKRQIPLPPGPTSWPLIGNAADLPREQERWTFAEWRDKWAVIRVTGGIIHISAFGQRIMIVNNGRVAYEMLVKKSSIYSGRSVQEMAGRLIGWAVNDIVHKTSGAKILAISHGCPPELTL
ncbi:hypothetical protein EW146_g5522 [Bondarzewia mesenterica]|uniref:Cytochrome P450 n=1 Tax=Bondarzewia mesenterica TaxID=1095465 RepID=A0A4S4LT39_9AGAM|nr:hypothetical protein EW146_g5522 [Bondarzewia mesenterica]